MSGKVVRDEHEKIRFDHGLTMGQVIAMGGN
jgi:hypothetical protein